MSVFVGEKSSTDVIDNGTMSEDEVVASDIHVLFFLLLVLLLFFFFLPFFSTRFSSFTLRDFFSFSRANKQKWEES